MFGCYKGPEPKPASGDRFTIGFIIHNNPHKEIIPCDDHTGKWDLEKQTSQLKYLMTAHFLVFWEAHCVICISHFSNGLRVQTGHGSSSGKLIKYIWKYLSDVNVIAADIVDVLHSQVLHSPIWRRACVCECVCNLWALMGRPPFVKHLRSWTLATYAAPKIIESIGKAQSPPCFSRKTSRTECSSGAEWQLGLSAEHHAQWEK